MSLIIPVNYNTLAPSSQAAWHLYQQDDSAKSLNEEQVHQTDALPRLLWLGLVLGCSTVSSLVPPIWFGQRVQAEPT